jgi:AcrR family transcriptional regulator
MSADERRDSVLAAAVHEFARGGYAGTSTEAIARRAGISQPYLFRLFETKRALFFAAFARCCQRIEELFEEAAEGLVGEEALVAMGHAYASYLADADLLMLQLQGYAAATDPDIRAFVATRFSGLVAYVQGRTGAGADSLQQFFATGMLCNVTAALGLVEPDHMWEAGTLPLWAATASPTSPSSP